MRKSLVAAATVALTVLIIGCPSPISDSSGGSSSYGSLAVTTGGALSGQTITPIDDLKSQVDNYRLEFTNHSGGRPDFTIDPYAEGQNVADIPTGQWQIALLGRDASATVIATGTPDGGNPVTIASGPNSVAVTLAPLSAGNGTFALAIDFPPAMVDAATITMDPWPPGAAGGAPITLTAGVDYTADFAAGALTMNATLPSAAYLMQLSLARSVAGQPNPVAYPVREKIVHIYDNLTTDGTWSIAAAELTQPPAPPADLTVDVDPVTEAFTLRWTDASTTELGFRVYQDPIDATPEAVLLGPPYEVTSATLGFTGALPVTYNVVAYNDYGESAPATVQVTRGPFITRWKTNNAGDSSSNQISLPLVSNGTYNFVVDWGDGTSDTITAWNDPAKTHTYTSAGQYTVTINGVIVGWQFLQGQGEPWGPNVGKGDAEKLMEISNWGSLAFGDTEGQLVDAKNLIITATDAPDLSQTTSLAYAFFRAAALTNEDFSAWDTSTITEMTYMFGLAETFDGDISGWDTSAVTDMFGAFFYARAFTGDISGWDTAAVTNMSVMFRNADAFNRDLSAWNTAAVTNMAYMFTDTAEFNGDISGWNTSAVTSMRGMFGNTSVFNGNISGWNTASVTTMRDMFLDAGAFNGDLSGWDTAAVTNMNQMFRRASLFNNGGNPIGLENWTVQPTTDTGAMFFGSGVTRLPSWIYS